MAQPPLDESLTELRALMAEKAEARGGSLRAQLARAGRGLPRAVRREGRFLAQAETMAQNPRTARLVDPRAAARAHDRVARHLRGLDPLGARRRRRLDLLALAGFYVLVTFGAVVAVLVWRGLV